MRKAQISPVTRFVRALDGEYYMLSEVARALSIQESTLRMWRRDRPQQFGPSYMTHFGDLAVYLYTPEDIERVRSNIPDHYRLPSHAGRVRMWTVLERRDRNRRMMQVRYWRDRVEILQARKDPAGAKAATAQADGIHAELEREHRARRRALGLAP